MKLSKLATICKKSKQIYIIDKPDGEGIVQWAGVGAAFYELAGMPEFSPETLFVSLGFDLDEKNLWILSREKEKERGLNLGIADDSDIEVKLDNMGSITYKGSELLIAYASGKAWLFDKKYFAPLKMDANFTASLRKFKDSRVLVTRDGLFPTAIIAPIKTEALKDWLVELTQKL